ncbi:DUF732 domain-containing protein [Gordonia hydrophobica]|uniref:DUF732 domain-containing protein n=1 Tax=Gordonia hydrophobica TaxID=40516 RepID=A0ABZ2U4R6_9ACTN|nr:DUF732 domain-containing protein [Gordonia hydrophobica]MBM7368201.1 hypothetical protein [Gordonia hydrophobica]
MTAKYIRFAAVAGALAVTVVALTACSDSSTASAPIGTEPVTTTTMPGSEPASSSKSATSSASKGDSQQAKDAASKASTSLPATKPNATTTAPDDFPGDKNPPSNVKLTDKDKAYLNALKKQNVSFMGDDDNNVALTMGHYVCEARGQKADPMLVKAYVRAAIGPMTKTEAEANTKSDKVIAAAEKNLC